MTQLPQPPAQALAAALEQRFGDAPSVDPATPGLPELARLAQRRTQRAYLDKPVEPGLLRLLCAVALAAPSKSDLQQRDILILENAEQRRAVTRFVTDEYPWIATAPVFLLFLANNRRQRQIRDWRAKPFPNDHLDAFFNASVDAGIVLSAFVIAAEAAGLGTCPISAIRNHAAAVSEAVGLPDHVFPIAGLALGWPAQDGKISPRLPLSATVHVDRFSETTIRQEIDAYDRRREAVQPYARQRFVEDFGTATPYGWSEDKARQYSRPERADFGAFIRAKGFRLD